MENVELHEKMVEQEEEENTDFGISMLESKLEPKQKISTKPEIKEEHPEDSKVQENEPQQELSKRQRKKLLKLQKFEERKKLKRKSEKEKRKLKRAVALEQGIEMVRNGPSRKVLKLNKIEKNPADISVAIDLSFDELMLEKDLSSCAAQLMRVYTHNRRAKKPIRVHFTGLKTGGKLYEKLERNSGWKNWDVKAHEESYMDLFDKEKIIYLTSESDNVLDKLESGAVYIIGGLVDHNHHKCLTHELAQKNSLRTARLPLSEHLIIKTRTVLTINQVFEIILGVSEGITWKETLLKTLPLRKKVKPKDDKNEVNPEDEESASDIKDEIKGQFS